MITIGFLHNRVAMLATLRRGRNQVGTVRVSSPQPRIVLGDLPKNFKNYGDSLITPLGGLSRVWGI